MPKLYMLNPGTKKLHIIGNCRYARNGVAGMKYYDTIDDVRKSSGGDYIWCKNCQKAQERKMQKSKNK